MYKTAACLSVSGNETRKLLTGEVMLYMNRELSKAIKDHYKIAKQKCIAAWNEETTAKTTEMSQKEYTGQYDAHQIFEQYGSISDIWNKFTSVELIYTSKFGQTNNTNNVDFM